jgi:hypothetical protein
MAVRIAVVLCLLVQDTPRLDDSGLRMLRPIQRKLDEGLAEVVKGTKPAEAFKPFKPESVPIDRTTTLLADMKSNGVVRGETFAIELEVQLWSAGKCLYVIKVLAHVTPAEASFVALTGRAFDGVARNGIPIAKCVGDAEPFKDAGQYLVKQLAEGKVDSMVFADPERLKKRVPKQFLDTIADGVKKSKEGAAAVAKDVAALKYDEVRIQAGEHCFTSLGADGSTKDGFIRGKIRLSEAGEVIYRLSRFETE